MCSYSGLPFWWKLKAIISLSKDFPHHFCYTLSHIENDHDISAYFWSQAIVHKGFSDLRTTDEFCSIYSSCSCWRQSLLRWNKVKSYRSCMNQDAPILITRCDVLLKLFEVAHILPVRFTYRIQKPLVLVSSHGLTYSFKSNHDQYLYKLTYPICSSFLQKKALEKYMLHHITHNASIHNA